MRAIRQFEEFIRENVVKKQSPDKSRAGFLVKESERSYKLLFEMLKKIGMANENANMFVKSCYDILMELIRAKMLLDGYNASGFRAHEAEVSYLRKLGFAEIDVQFADQVRFFRNGMLYYGTMLDKEYAEKTIKFTKKVYPKLKEMLKMKPVYLIIEGIDGSGKGTALDGLKEWAVKKKLKVLDVRDYWKTKKGYPEIKDFDVIITCEPTYSEYGKKLRFKIIKSNTKYSKKDIAEAFAKDRKEHYEKLIIPAIKEKKLIFQERSVLSSFIYQIDGEVSKQFVEALEGNQIALKTPPDKIIITNVNPEVVIERLRDREKKDDAIFEKLEFQKMIAKRYQDEEFKNMINTEFSEIDTNPPKTPSDTKQMAVSILESLV